MATIVFGQNLVFWSGVIAGVLFALNYLTCFAMPWANRKIAGTALCQRHKLFAWLAIAAAAIHIIMAVLTYVFHIWF